MTHRHDQRIAELVAECKRLRRERAHDLMTERVRAYWADPTNRAKASAKMKAVNADPAVRAKHALANASPVTRAKKRAAAKRRMETPEGRAILERAQQTAEAANAAKWAQRKGRPNALAAIPADPFESALFGGSR